MEGIKGSMTQTKYNELVNELENLNMIIHFEEDEEKKEEMKKRISDIKIQIKDF